MNFDFLAHVLLVILLLERQLKTSNLVAYSGDGHVWLFVCGIGGLEWLADNPSLPDFAASDHLYHHASR